MAFTFVNIVGGSHMSISILLDFDFIISIKLLEKKLSQIDELLYFLL